MYPFVFNPFGRNNTVNILDLVIPKVKTIAIGESTENVVLGICCTSCLNINQDIWAAMRVAHIL